MSAFMCGLLLTNAVWAFTEGERIAGCVFLLLAVYFAIAWYGV